MNEQPKPVPSNYFEELNRVRLILYLETTALSNQYHQVILTPAQLKKLGTLFPFFLNSQKLSDGRNGIAFVIAEESITLPSEIRDCYEGEVPPVGPLPSQK